MALDCPTAPVPPTVVELGAISTCVQTLSNDRGYTWGRY